MARLRGPCRVALALVAGLAASTPVIEPAPVRAQTVDTVHIHLEGDGALVRHGVPSAVGVIEAYALRMPGQDLTLTGVARASGPVEYTLIEQGAALRIAVASLADITVQYRVEGERERVPLFVPGGGAVVTVAHGLEEPFLVRVTGADGSLDDIDTATSMPRFIRAADGALEVRLSSLPSFVRLSRGGPLSFSRLADVAALLLILAGAMFAYRRLRA